MPALKRLLNPTADSGADRYFGVNLMDLVNQVLNSGPDYTIFDNSDTYTLKNNKTGDTTTSSTDIGTLFNTAVTSQAKGSLSIKDNGTYFNATTKLQLKKYWKVYSDGATIKNNNSLSVLLDTPNDDVLYQSMLSGLVLDANDSTFSNGYTGFKPYSVQKSVVDIEVKNASTAVDFEVSTTATPVETVQAKRNTLWSRFSFHLDNVSTGIILNGSPTGDYGSPNSPVVITENEFRVTGRQIKTKGIRWVQYTDSNTWQKIHLSMNGNNSSGLIFNDSADTSVNKGIYDELLESTDIDCFGVTGVNAVTLNNCKEIVISKLYGSPDFSGGSWPSGTFVSISGNANDYFINSLLEHKIYINKQIIQIGKTFTGQVASNYGVVIGTEGIAEGIEYVTSSSGGGYGLKVYGVDLGNGVTGLRIAQRSNSQTWSDLCTITSKGVLLLTNTIQAPTDTPSGGGYLYTDSGALKYKGSSGTVTTLGSA